MSDTSTETPSADGKTETERERERVREQTHPNAYDEGAEDAIGLLASAVAMRGNAPAQSASDALRDRRNAFSDVYKGKRDYYDVLGYPKEISTEDFLKRYERQDVAQTLVNKPATTTWRHPPEVHDDTDGDDDTPFETDVSEVLNGDHMTSTLTKYCEWADRVTGIGEYGVLILGLKDNRQLDQAVNESALSGPEDLAYCRPVGQADVSDWELVTDAQDDRYGWPETYTIELETPGAKRGVTESEELTIHYSRVIHIVENPREYELKGTPRLEPVYNRLLDLEKVVGAAAEMFWSSAEPRWHADVRDDFEDLSPEEYAKFEEQTQEAIHGLRKVVQTKGMNIDVLDGQTPDPSGVVDVIYQQIAGQSEMPQSMLKGNETGERATTEDKAMWYGRMIERQRQFAEAVIFRPIIDRLVTFGVIRPPTETGYEIEWPPLFEASEQDKADTAHSWARALKELHNAIMLGAPAETAYEQALGWDVPEKYAAGAFAEATPPTVSHIESDAPEQSQTTARDDRDRDREGSTSEAEAAQRTRPQATQVAANATDGPNPLRANRIAEPVTRTARLLQTDGGQTTPTDDYEHGPACSHNHSRDSGELSNSNESESDTESSGDTESESESKTDPDR